MNNKFIRVIKNPVRILKFLLNQFAFLFSDKYFLKLKYFLIMGKQLNLNSPKSFNEKLQWLKLNDKKYFYTQLADKVEAKKYVANIIGENYIIPTLGIYNRFEDIDFDELPNQFVLKCTHDSGGVVICTNKNAFNFISAKKKINKHLKINPYYSTREFPYKNIKPRILAEKFIFDKKSQDLLDYKFMVFNGKIRSLFVTSQKNMKTEMKVDFFDKNWKHLPFKRHYSNSELIIPKPNLFTEMKQLAEELASKIKAPFISVDFYEVNNQIYFGEITFYPGGGWERFSPEKWDYTFGGWIDLSNKDTKEYV